MKKILAFLLAAMLLLSIVGCAAQTQSDAQPAAAEPAADTSQPTQDSVSAADGDTVTIGYYLPLSGANATYSPYYLNAINLAIKKINAEPIREEKKKDNTAVSYKTKTAQNKKEPLPEERTEILAQMPKDVFESKVNETPKEVDKIDFEKQLEESLKDL